MTSEHSMKLANALAQIKELHQDYRFEEALSFSTTLDFDPFPPELDIELAYCLMALGRPLPAFNRLQRASSQVLQSYDPSRQYLLHLALCEAYALHNEFTGSSDQLEMAENLSVYLPLEYQSHLFLETAKLWFLIGQRPRAQKALSEYEQLIDISPDRILSNHDRQSVTCLKYALAYSNGEGFTPNINEMMSPDIEAGTKEVETFQVKIIKALTLLSTTPSLGESSSSQLSQLIDTLPEGLWKRWLLKETLKKLMFTKCEHKPILDLILKTL